MFLPTKLFLCSMSRLIVKNLPTKIKAEKLKEKFSHYGNVTDMKLMYTKAGKFRHFAFIGFQQPNEADTAKSSLDKTMFLNQQIIVETCRNFGVQEKFNRKKDAEKLIQVSNEKHKKLNEVEKSEIKMVSDNSKQKVKTVSDSDFLKLKRKTDLSDDEDVLVNEKLNNNASPNFIAPVKFTIKMRGYPYDIKVKQIEEFFYPLKVTDINLKRNVHGSRTGIAYVNFSTESDQIEAMKHNGAYIKGRYIELFKLSPSNNVRPYDNLIKDKGWIDKMVSDHDDCNIEDISESGRLFLRNLPFSCTEDDLEKTFEKFGPLSEINIPIDSLTRKGVGFGYITFMMPDHALKAFNEMDGTAFQGRMLHILPSKEKIEHKDVTNPDEKSSYKKKKAAEEKKSSQSSHNWNALFIGTNAVADAIAEKYNEDKSVIMDSTKQHSAAVRMALGETQIVKETRDFLIESGLSLDAFSQPNAQRSKTVLLAKNLPVGATCSELRDMFEKHAQLGRVVLAPAGVTAVIECLEPTEARTAFTKLAYRKFHHAPLYLEWAPVGVFVKTSSFKQPNKVQKESEMNIDSQVTNDNKESEDITEEDHSESVTVFVKNLNFDTTEEGLHKHFESSGQLLSCTISRKKTHKSNNLLSMGYGFVTFESKKAAKEALKNLQNSFLDGHKLELKLSERKVPQNLSKSKQKQEHKKQKTSKILVRNIPFQANAAEISSLFKSYGELKTVRLPKKLTASLGQGGNHRGFAFVDFVTKEDAKNAFEALCHSTHLYGRRLVLEWADTEENSVEQLRRKTSDHFHGEKKRRKHISAIEDAIGDADNDSE